MMTDRPWWASSSRMTRTFSSWSSAAPARRRGCARAARRAPPPGPPPARRWPCVGCPPVIATMLLSRMKTLMLVSSRAASSSGAMPEWVKVPSPMTHSDGRHARVRRADGHADGRAHAQARVDRLRAAAGSPARSSRCRPSRAMPSPELGHHLLDGDVRVAVRARVAQPRRARDQHLVQPGQLQRRRDRRRRRPCLSTSGESSPLRGSVPGELALASASPGTGPARSRSAR